VPSTLDVAAVYREHFDYVFTNLRRLGVPTSSLEDACHDVFVVVHRRARTYDHRCAMRTWLYGVVRRVAADMRRGGTRHSRRVEAMRTVAPRTVAADDVVADRCMVQDFLDALDEGKRDVFILVELEEMTAAEVAQALQINPNTAAARLRAARRIFAERVAAIASTENELRLISLARAPEPVDAPTRARVWTGLAPIVLGGAKTSLLVAAGWAAGLVLATTAIVGAVGPTATPMEAIVHAQPMEPSPPLVAKPAGDDSPALAGVIETPIDIPTAAPVQTPTRTTPPAQRVPRVPAPVETRSVPAPAPDPVRQPATDAELRAETELAGRVLRATDPKEILALVDEYRQKFANGFFADRLAARRIEALCRTDRRTLAQTEHTALARRQPALAKKALATCDADHESTSARPSSG
jgi:RNA polymerase sigma-70 factor (ECF subfamily)